MDPWTTPLGPQVYERNAFRAPFLMVDSDKWLSGNGHDGQTEGSRIIFRNLPEKNFYLPKLIRNL